MTFNSFDYYFVYDKPIPYKEGKPEELLIYPVTMENYWDFHIYATCFLLEKNHIAEAISMSYLEYLYSITDNKNQLIYLFDALLRLVLQRPNMEFRPRFDNNKKPYFEIDGNKYNSSDFDNIRKIISEQNMFELPNELIQKNIRDKMAEARRFREKINNSKMASLEDQIIAVSIYTGWDIEKIYKMTIRKFIKTLQRADHMLHSKIYLSASMSGFVEFKDKSVIKHWLAEIVPNNDDVTVGLDEVESKVNMSAI